MERSASHRQVLLPISRPASSGASSVSTTAFWACSRFSAWSNTRAVRPIHHLVRYLIPAVGGQAVQHVMVPGGVGKQPGLHLEIPEIPRPLLLSSSWPMLAQTSVYMKSASSHRLDRVMQQLQRAAACGIYRRACAVYSANGS